MKKFIVVLFVFCQGIAFGDVDEKYLHKFLSKSAVHIKYIPCLSIAYEHFVKNDMAEKSDRDNYLVFVKADQNVCIVTFQVPLSEMVVGGGAVEYRINNDGKILSFVGYE